MRKWLVVIFATLVFATSASAEQWIRWKPVCRHNAIYWAITVGEQFPTRIMYGYFTDRVGIKYYHVQPQLHAGGKWWYFRVENDHVTIISKPTFKIIYENTGETEDTEWHASFHFESLKDYIEYMKCLWVKRPQ